MGVEVSSGLSSLERNKGLVGEWLSLRKGEGVSLKACCLVRGIGGGGGGTEGNGPSDGLAT